MPETVKEYIEKLAKENNITYQESSLDIFAKKVTELSGDTINEDHTSNLMIALKRSNIIEKGEFVKLLSRHIKERNNSK